MPYPAGHRAKIRQKIVQAARRLFNQRGFENVSINEIMGAAGLTAEDFTVISQARRSSMLKR
jgi:AcrR family transcriptional regulator